MAQQHTPHVNALTHTHTHARTHTHTPTHTDTRTQSLTFASASPPLSRARAPLVRAPRVRNNKGVVSDWRIVLALPIFWLIDLLLSIRPVAQALFGNVRDREVLAKVLQSIYGWARARAQAAEGARANMRASGHNTHTHTQTHTHMHMHMHMHPRTRAHNHTKVHTHMRTLTYTRASVHTCMSHPRPAASRAARSGPNAGRCHQRRASPIGGVNTHTTRARILPPPPLPHAPLPPRCLPKFTPDICNPSNKEAVDDDLVSIIAAPSYDAGALDVFVSVITGAGRGLWGLAGALGAGGILRGRRGAERSVVIRLSGSREAGTGSALAAHSVKHASATLPRVAGPVGELVGGYPTLPPPSCHKPAAGPPGPKPWDLLPKVTAPIFIAWG
jgi:hypothetical protein